uniref:UPF0200 protein ENO77_00630 n=1 Tax=Ignisphaera aggregans TaxID=334771 RepID=A0A7C2VL12_9CREN
MIVAQRILVLIAGLPGAGKTVFSEVARAVGIPVVVLGDVVREEVRKRGLQPSLESVLAVAQELRERYGREAIVMLALPIIVELLKHHCVVVVDGVRSIDEVNYIKNKVDADILVVAIHASPKTRFARISARNRAGDPKSWEEFVKRDYMELSWGIGNIIALADKMLVNEGSVEEFKNSVRELLQEVIARWCT